MGAHPSRPATNHVLLPRAQRSVLRIATTISLLLATIALIAAIGSSKGSASVVLGLAWVVAWGCAGLYPERLASIVGRQPGLSAALTIGALIVTVVATGGPESNLKNSLNWLSWVYLVASTPGAACAVAGCTSAAMAASLFISDPEWLTQTEASARFFVLTELADPLVAAAVGVILITVFRRVLGQADSAAPEISAGGYASTPALAALIAGPTRAELPLRGLSAADHAHAGLRETEREVVDLLAGGLTPKEIALLQGRSDDSVYRTINAAKERTGTRTIEQLVAVAWIPAR